MHSTNVQMGIKIIIIMITTNQACTALDTAKLQRKRTIKEHLKKMKKELWSVGYWASGTELQ